MQNITTFKNIKIAHRGLFDNKKIPENSTLAFKKAIDKNIPIELDVQVTKDDVLVVFHDIDLSRLTNSNKLVKDLTYDELKKYCLLNSEEIIPTFKEVLKLINGKVLIDIEIKNTDTIEKIGTLLVSDLKNYSGTYMVKSFNPKIVRWFMKNYPSIPRGLLITDNYKNKFYDYLFTSRFMMLYCKPTFLAISKKILNTPKMQNYRKKYPVLVWTLDNIEEFNKYKNFADSYICNNLPYYK